MLSRISRDKHFCAESVNVESKCYLTLRFIAFGYESGLIWVNFSAALIYKIQSHAPIFILSPFKSIYLEQKHQKYLHEKSKNFQQLFKN